MEDIKKRFAELANGQQPDAMFIGCCDSRVMHHYITGCGPGDMFVLRNIGNQFPTEDSGYDGDRGAIEFAVTVLGIKKIIVCGHSNCGAMQAVAKKLKGLPQGSLKNWLSHINNPAELTDENELAKENVIEQMRRLKSDTLTSELVANNKLAVEGWFFDIGSAEIYKFDEESKSFSSTGSVS